MRPASSAWENIEACILPGEGVHVCTPNPGRRRVFMHAHAPPSPLAQNVVHACAPPPSVWEG